MKEYTVGFLFDEELQKVVLIRKTHPEWQKGLLNGVGGKVEEGETPLVAMHREWKEEVDIGSYVWKHFLTMYFNHAEIHYFAATDPEDKLMIPLFPTPTDEKPEIFRLSDILFSTELVYNLRATLPLAIDYLKHLRTEADSPNNLKLRR